MCAAATLRAPSTRRRLQGAGLFVLGLAMLVAGVAVKATMIGGFPVLSVLGFVVMFAGVVFAVTGPPVAAGRDHGGAAAPARVSGAARAARRFVHQPHGGPLPPSVRRVTTSRTITRCGGCPAGFAPIGGCDRPACAQRMRLGPTSPHCVLSWDLRLESAVGPGDPVRDTEKSGDIAPLCGQVEQSGAMWGIVADMEWRIDSGAG